MASDEPIKPAGDSFLPLIQILFSVCRQREGDWKYHLLEDYTSQNGRIENVSCNCVVLHFFTACTIVQPSPLGKNVSCLLYDENCFASLVFCIVLMIWRASPSSGLPQN